MIPHSEENASLITLKLRAMGGWGGRGGPNVLCQLSFPLHGNTKRNLWVLSSLSAAFWHFSQNEQKWSKFTNSEHLHEKVGFSLLPEEPLPSDHGWFMQLNISGSPEPPKTPEKVQKLSDILQTSNRQVEEWSSTGRRPRPTSVLPHLIFKKPYADYTMVYTTFTDIHSTHRSAKDTTWRQKTTQWNWNMKTELTYGVNVKHNFN